MKSIIQWILGALAVSFGPVWILANFGGLGLLAIVAIGLYWINK